MIRNWTFLYYLNGENDLREHVSLSVGKLHESGAPTDTAVIAQLYRGDYRWSLKTLPQKLKSLCHPPAAQAVASDWRGRRTYQMVAPGQSVEIGRGEEKPSDWRSLRDFLIEGMQKFPSRHTMLVLAGHGAGSQGLLADGDGNRIAPADLRRALGEAQQATGRKVDVLLLESCKMGVPEVTRPLQQAGVEVLASPEKVLMGRARHDRLLAEIAKNSSLKPKQLASTACSILSPQLQGLRHFQAPPPAESV